MALVIADRVRETTTTTGTGTITLAGAVTNFETFTANLSNSDTTYYSIVDNTNGAFEVGLGTFTASGTTLARTTIIASSNSNSAVDFGAGTKDVFITIPASKMIVKDASGNVSIDGDVTIADGSNDFDVASHDGTNGLKLGGTLVTSSAAELNILDGKSFVDEDNMASNSATAIPSQQSVKAYVDTQITAEDLDFQADSGGALSIDLDSETLTFTGGTGIDTSGSGNAVTFAIDSTVGTLAGTQTLTNKTLTSPKINEDVALTATATELNLLDGVSGLAQADFTKLAAVDSTATELNLVDGSSAGTIVNSKAVVYGSSGEVNATTLQIAGASITASAADINLIDGITNGTVIASKAIITDSNKDISGGRNITISGELDAATLDISGDADIDGTLEADAITVNGTALATVIAGTTVNNATLASTVTVSDSTANTNFPVVFHDESNALLDDTGALRYNPSTGELLVPKLTVAGTTTTVDTVTINAQNAIVFEGATADSHETTLTITDPTADRTITLPDTTGTVSLTSATETLTNKTLTTPVINGFSGTGDGSIIGDLTAKTSDGAILKLQTSDTTVVSGNYLGKIEFSAPDEASGTDAVLTAGYINSYARGTFASNYNGADLLFGTGYSSAANVTMWLEHTGLLNLYSNSRGGVPGINLRYGSTSSSQGNIIFTNSDGQLCFGADGNTSNVVFKLDDEDGQPIFTFSEEGGTVILDGGDTDVTVHKPLIANSTYTGGGLMTTGGNIVIPDAGNIGSASDTDAIAIASDGKVTFSQEIIAPSLDISGNVDIDGTLETDALSLNGTSMTATASELNLLDGGTSVGSSITIADSDGIIVNDGGTMKSVPASDIKTYAGGDSASKGFATAMAIAL